MFANLAEIREIFFPRKFIPLKYYKYPPTSIYDWGGFEGDEI